jgi:hypothetical protein
MYHDLTHYRLYDRVNRKTSMFRVSIVSLATLCFTRESLARICNETFQTRNTVKLRCIENRRWPTYHASAQSEFDTDNRNLGGLQVDRTNVGWGSELRGMRTGNYLVHSPSSEGPLPRISGGCDEFLHRPSGVFRNRQESRFVDRRCRLDGEPLNDNALTIRSRHAT